MTVERRQPKALVKRIPMTMSVFVRLWGIGARGDLASALGVGAGELVWGLGHARVSIDPPDDKKRTLDGILVVEGKTAQTKLDRKALKNASKKIAARLIGAGYAVKRVMG